MNSYLQKIVQEHLDPPLELLVCEICGHALADIACKAIVMGLHSHLISTQQGNTLRFDCFSDAPGIAVESSKSLERTPFPNYQCVPALCGQCEEQMGWFFEGPDPFYGILSDRTEKIRRADRE